MSLREVNKSDSSWYRRNCYVNFSKGIEITAIVFSTLALLGFILIQCYPNAMTGELGKLKSSLIKLPLLLGLIAIINISCIKIHRIKQRDLLENSNSSEWQEKRIQICKKILEDSGYNVIMANKPNSGPI